MDWFLQQSINGLALGAIYALIALGYTMVYGVLRFINFAHSDVLMLGAFAAGLLRSQESAILERSRSVLAKARRRLAALGAAVHDDARLSVMFDKMGI